MTDWNEVSAIAATVSAVASAIAAVASFLSVRIAAVAPERDRMERDLERRQVRFDGWYVEPCHDEFRKFVESTRPVLESASSRILGSRSGGGASEATFLTKSAIQEFRGRFRALRSSLTTRVTTMGNRLATTQTYEILNDLEDTVTNALDGVRTKGLQFDFGAALDASNIRFMRMLEAHRPAKKIGHNPMIR